MNRKKLSRVAILSLVLSGGGFVWMVGHSPVTHAQQAQTQQAQTSAALKLELFAQQPTEGSAPLSSLDITQSANLADLKADTHAREARYLRVTVNKSGGADTRVYRVLIAPSSGRVFIVSQGQVVTLDNLLREGGLQVAKDNKAVTLGSGEIDLKVAGIETTASSSASTQSAQNTPSSTASGTPSATTPSSTTTPATTTTTPSTTPPADTSTTAPSTSTPSTTPPADTGTTPSGTTPSTTATPSTTTPSTTTPSTSEPSSATPSTTTTPSTTAPSTTTPSTTTPSSTTPSTSTTTPSTTTTPAATTPATATTEGQPLTEAVNQDIGKLSLSVLPTAATAPTTSETNFYLLPFTDATSPTQSISGNVVTLGYASSASMADVAAYYDKLMTDQGFTKVADDAANKTSDAQIVQVYKRGDATVTLTIDRDAQGVYKVTVDLSKLVASLGQ